MVYLRYIFILYVILLAGYVSYNKLMYTSFSRYHVEFTPPQYRCYEGDVDWSYCVFKSEKATTDTFLYALHGKGESEKYWLKDTGYPALLQQLWGWKKEEVPTVVSISFGPVWLASPKLSKSETGVLERLEKEVLPRIEGNLGAPKQRFLLGGSMGALNALSWALGSPQTFLKVAALCPPLFQISPFDGWNNLVQFVGRTGAMPHSVLTVLGLGRLYFANSNEWEKFSPLARVQRARFHPSQRFYITAGIRDEFGLFEGAKEFVSHLARTGAKTYWKPNSGDHCSVDVASLAHFLKL